MNRLDLMSECDALITRATVCEKGLDHYHASQHMSALLDLLIEELVGSAPAAGPAPGTSLNPEQILQEISIAIKHRTYSRSERWNIVYYHARLTCVPAYVNIPPEIILNEFTERMVQRGFSVIYWNQLKQNVAKLYKELNP